MIDLATTYMGILLRNPIVIASSGLSSTLKGVQRCVEAGAGAVVLKSLFEEQIAAEIHALGEFSDQAAPGEGADYLQGYGMALGPLEYLKLVREAKQAVAVPIIASLNCTTDQRWTGYAKQLETAGADAIELNVALLPNQPRIDGPAIEAVYGRILHAVKSQVAIPVAMKVGPYFSSFAHFAERLTRDRVEAAPFTVGWCGPSASGGKVVWQGADALVLFNRFYQFDIDIEQLRVTAGHPFSSPAEIHTPLRWISLLAGHVDCDLAAATGIHGGRDVIKQLLAGARVVQVCSTLHQHGLDQIGRMLQELREWMTAHNFDTLDDFRGRLSQVRSEYPENFERLQYVKALGGR
jgi:dihydroorotate dehydrogenase (fumarate)